MSVQLFNSMNMILSMPYFRNENARSGGAKYAHEEAVADLIKLSGFNEIHRSEFPKLKKTILKVWSETGNDEVLRSVISKMECGTYILQPAGTQNFPDILIKDFDNRLIAVECKSGISGLTPMWNDNLPKPNTIYVLSSGKLNQTTVFLGKDVMDLVMLENQKKMIAELTSVVNKYKPLNKELDRFNRGWTIKFRPQNFQSGGSEKTNYFTHQSRKQCELNVLEFCK